MARRAGGGTVYFGVVVGVALPVTYALVSDVFVNQPDIGSVSTITSAQLAWFLGQAEAEINANVAQRYTLPFGSVPPLITAIAADLATYNVLAKRLFTAKRLEDSPWPDRYKEAREKLEQIRKGELQLANSSGTLIAVRTDIVEVWSNTSDYAPTFDELPPHENVIDPDKIDDLRDDKDLL